jgi:SAM-dependent methyltransferase
MSFKDNFSSQAAVYAQFRPKYPSSMYDFLLSLCSERSLLWDCATGNGQVCEALAGNFSQIIATDASEAQIRNAVHLPNVEYRVASAEASGLESHSMDMITVAQAIHWFDFDKFYSEVRRVAKPNGLLAIWGYGLCSIQKDIDEIVLHLYSDILGEKYWDAERKHLDNHYQSIPFPFEALPCPKFYMELDWTLEEFVGYLSTWSSVQKYIRQNQQNPIDLVIDDLSKSWKENTYTISWELYLKVARVHEL